MNKKILTTIIVTLLIILLSASVSALNLTLEWTGEAYESSGTWNFSFDSGKNSEWHNISWNSVEPENTSIKFRARTAADEASLSLASWSSYIENSGDPLNVDNNRWIETEVTLETNDTSISPTLIDFTINYANVTLPTYAEFSSDPDTTDFSLESDLTNISDLVLSNQHASINWSGSGYNVYGQDLDAAITFAENFVDINTTLLPTFAGKSALITFKSTSYTGTYEIYRDGVLCGEPVCIQISNNPVQFSVTNFSNYTTQPSSTRYGYANVTVLATTDIEMIRDTVNFTNTNPGDTRVSTVAADVDDGATCDPYCGLLISNNGSVEVNISITNAERLFDGGSYVAASHYLYNVTHYGGLAYNDPLGDGSGTVCSSGNIAGNTCDGSWWCPFPDEGLEHSTAICALNQTDGHDMVEIEINITIPLDEPAGQKDATIKFTATAWNPGNLLF